ncbi:LysR family transcriptional regulator [Pseudoalteromonas sp. MMG005]|uniref:LysR family transcriptional regulator n=1 Tax=Pseudoalteromonas sp. MMG005 TaxID=2822682 RepID=UPI001B3A33AB|nr:LysR family transcriptional regulator [Pseudoalteromonas sp. MMG005]MBQ4847001.1 LysR family transcriptional regulator [Pseudoalteromonas sp. MMG005]
MNNNQLFDGILIFVQVVKSGGFGAAAQTLGHSSSHVSKEVIKLESRLGVRLLNRTTRSVALTPEGEAYFQQCEQLVIDAQSALSLVTQNDEIPRGALKISCPIGFSHDHLKPVIAKYMQQYPNVSLEWDVSDKRIDVIGDGFDLAVRAAPTLDESSLICKRIYSCPTYIVASKSYISKYGKPYHPRELVNHNAICYSNLKMPGRWEFEKQGEKPFSVDVKQRIKCNNGHMELAMVKAGLGICRLPEFFMGDALTNDDIEVLFADYTHPTVNVYVIYPSRKHLSPKVRRFIDMLSEELKE